jgi:uncharacterized protein
MNRFLPVLIFPLLLAAFPAAAQQPSFDCAAATQPLENLICGDADLAALDTEMAGAYRARIAATSGDAQSTLRLEQRAWAANRASACGVTDEAAIEVDDAIGCLAALYHARIDALKPHEAQAAPTAPSMGYAWLMGEWRVTAVRMAPGDAARAAAAKSWVGRGLALAEAPIVTLSGSACSFPRYHAEPQPGPEFGDLSQYPTAVMVRVSCVGVALLDLVRLTDDQVLLSEGEAVLELERRR